MNSAQENIPHFNEGQLIFARNDTTKLARISDRAHSHAGKIAHKSYRPGRVEIEIFFNVPSIDDDENAYLDEVTIFSSGEEKHEYVYYTSPQGSLNYIGYWTRMPDWKYDSSTYDKSAFGIRWPYGVDLENWQGGWTGHTIFLTDCYRSESYRLHIREFWKSQTIEKTQTSTYYQTDNYKGTKVIIVAHQLFGNTFVKTDFVASLRDRDTEGRGATTSDNFITLNFNEKGELVSMG